jgi:hypothetical protein
VQFGTFSLAYCIGLDFTEIFVAVAVGVVSFYLAHWEELFVEHLVLGPLTGPTELLIAAISVYVVTYFFGHSFWDSVAFSLDFGPDFLRGAYDVRTIAFFVIVGGAASAGLSSLFNGLRQAFSRGKSFPEALRPMAPFLLYLVASAVWLRLSWSHYLQAPDNAHAYIHTLGTVFCLVCVRLLLTAVAPDRGPDHPDSHQVVLLLRTEPLVCGGRCCFPNPALTRSTPLAGGRLGRSRISPLLFQCISSDC